MEGHRCTNHHQAVPWEQKKMNLPSPAQAAAAAVLSSMGWWPFHSLENPLGVGTNAVLDGDTNATQGHEARVVDPLMELIGELTTYVVHDDSATEGKGSEHIDPASSSHKGEVGHSNNSKGSTVNLLSYSNFDDWRL